MNRLIFCCVQFFGNDAPVDFVHRKWFLLYDFICRSTVTFAFAANNGHTYYYTQWRSEPHCRPTQMTEISVVLPAYMVQRLYIALTCNGASLRSSRRCIVHNCRPTTFGLHLLVRMVRHRIYKTKLMPLGTGRIHTPLYTLNWNKRKKYGIPWDFDGAIAHRIHISHTVHISSATFVSMLSIW